MRFSLVSFFAYSVSNFLLKFGEIA